MRAREGYRWSVGSVAMLLVFSVHAQQPSPESEDAPLVDASLPSIMGHRRLSDERGKRVVVLFYEDKAHIYDNDAFKGELRRYVADNHLEDRVVLYGVANLGDVGSVPESLVRALIRPAVERWGADILLDWQGMMRKPPFRFETDASNVGLIDREGRLRFRYTGVMTEESKKQFYRILRLSLR
ncbi:MAG: hypothetical protein NZM37_08955 [Sandaracinaceae bacterium]|nr:hypothetical protein [Sandaracinaceae bacterium]MDW8247261.1 hypothetical protein [Sandaracinaceae bacterium]